MASVSASSDALAGRQVGVAVCVVASLVALAACWLGMAAADADEVPPPRAPRSEAAAARSAPAAARMAAATERRAESTAAPPGSGRAAPTAFGRVQIAAVDLRTRRPIDGLSWRVVGEAVGMMPRGHSAHGEARIEVPLRTEAAVALSAPGYRESLPVDVSLRDGHFRRIEVPLAPIGALPCVRFTARTADGAPVTRLMVRWDPRLAGDAQRGYERGEDFVMSAKDGRFEAPLPAAGWGQLCVVAVDDADVALPLLPHRVEALAGDAPKELSEVRLEPGVLFVIDLAAASDPLSVASLRLATESGAILPVRFGLAPPSLGRPDAPWIRCVAAAAVAPGRYRLRAASGARTWDQPVDASAAGRVRIALR
jgi:hypothetical protein